jgi:hypothetical protein
MPAYSQKARRSAVMYAEPDTNSQTVGSIRPGMLMMVLDSQEEWLLVHYINYPDRRGWVNWQVFTAPESGVSPGPRRSGAHRGISAARGIASEAAAATVPTGPSPESLQPALEDDEPEVVEEPPAEEPEPDVESQVEELSPPQDQKIDKSGLSGTALQVARVWNKYGGLLARVAQAYSIEPAAAVAVLAVESGGAAFGPNKRMIIRFENHLFYRLWGNKEEQTFNKHFKFDAESAWKGHLWRADPAQDWQSFHGNQLKEWEVLNFARTLKGKAAKMSISMGAPQILGSNYARLGFDDVHQMFDAFNHPAYGEKNQIIGLFKFIESDPRNRGITALRNKDFEAFAAMYNGTGQAATYGRLIADRVRTFKQLRGG